MFKVYGENGITFKVAVKLEIQSGGYGRFLDTLRRRYGRMHRSNRRADFAGDRNDRRYLFPNFGKKGRSGGRGETCFGEPDMIVGTRKANFIFEFETGKFSRLIRRNSEGILKTGSLPYQLCRFYQLGELLLKLDNRTAAVSRNRSVAAHYGFAGKSGDLRARYYFNFRDNRGPHSFESAVLSLLGKKDFYVVSVTSDRDWKDALAGLDEMLGIVGNRFDRRRFIVLTYNDLGSVNCFGDALQLSLGDARQGFQVINLPGAR